MTRRLLVSYVTITVFALAVLVVPLGITFAGRERDRLVTAIERDAVAVASLAEEGLESGRGLEQIRPVLTRYAAGGGRVVVVDRQGFSVEDTGRLDDETRDFSTRPEIRTALEGRRAEGIRSSATLGQDLLYVAVPVASAGVVHGAVRISYPTSTLETRVRGNWLRLGALSAMVLVAVAGVGLVLARGVTRPVRHVEDASHRLADGDLSARVPAEEGPPELRSLATSFNVMADRLEQVVGANRRFVADASHQLRTPLTALQLQLEMLEDTVAAGPRAKVEAALAETERLGRLVESLLVLARADAGPLAATSVDVAAAVLDRAAVWRPVAGEHDVALVVEVPPDAVVAAIPGAMDQVLDNLLSNAIAVSPPGGAVRVTVMTGGDAVELHVVDDGPGMAPEQRERAFERFWRAPGAAGKGFGLGLAIVHQLATASGGDVRLAAGPDGRGLDAVVTLPRAAPDLSLPLPLA